MNETRLRKLLREAPLPAAAEAERRGLAMVEAAFAEQRLAPRSGPARRRAVPRAAIALAAVALLGIALLSPAGAAVRNWIGDAFTAGVPNAARGLTRIPGGGELLVGSQAGPWVVQPDGSRRLLGNYEETTWSPHGLYVAGVEGRTLTALEPGGTPHWSLTAQAPISTPSWSPSGERIAYLAGAELRVVAGDGTEDRLIAPRTKALPPAWSPFDPTLLTYVNRPRGLTIRDVDSGEILGSAGSLPGISELEWGADGTLLEASPRAIRLRQVTPQKLTAGVLIGAPQWLSPPPGRIATAALAPNGRTVAAVVSRGSTRTPHDEVVLLDRRNGAVRQLFSAPGHLDEIAWSPRGDRLLVAWPAANQWLFIPTGGRGRIKAIGDIAGQFSPGGDHGAPFPSVSGWCCR